MNTMTLGITVISVLFLSILMVLVWIEMNQLRTRIFNLENQIRKLKYGKKD